MGKMQFEPKKYRRIDFSWYRVPSIGLGISIGKFSISVELPFIVFDLIYFTKKELAGKQRLANFFAKNAVVWDDDEDTCKCGDSYNH